MTEQFSIVRACRIWRQTVIKGARKYLRFLRLDGLVHQQVVQTSPVCPRLVKTLTHSWIIRVSLQGCFGLSILRVVEYLVLVSLTNFDQVDTVGITRAITTFKIVVGDLDHKVVVCSFSIRHSILFHWTRFTPIAHPFNILHQSC